jgi:DnaJ-class molecular chaperone
MDEKEKRIILKWNFFKRSRRYREKNRTLTDFIEWMQDLKINNMQESSIKVLVLTSGISLEMDPPIKCENCDGTGINQEFFYGFMNIDEESTCEVCNGRGNISSQIKNKLLF